MNAEREREREREREIGRMGARERLHVKETHTFLHKIWHRTYAKEARNTTAHNNADYQSSLVLLREEEHQSNENAVDDLALLVSFLRVREDQLFSVFFEITVNPPSSSPECDASTTPNDDHFFFLLFFFPTAKHRRRAPRARFCPLGRSFAGV